MAMTQRKFEDLVGGLQEYARREPKKYRMKVAALAALGFAYIVAVLFVSVTVVLALIGLAILIHLPFLLISPIIATAVLIGVVFRSLKVSFPKPVGRLLTAREAPALFAMLDDISDQLRAPRFHHVIIDDDYNASVAQVPRLGVFGWQVNYLMLGLPLMLALSPDHFRAVLAHEIGHLSQNHGRFGQWIYRVRAIWSQILDNIHDSGYKGADIFISFIRWYTPFFNAYTFVLARQNEYLADRAAAAVVGETTLAQSLVASKVHGKFLSQKFWPNLLRQALSSAEAPPAKPFASMFLELQSGSNRTEKAKWLHQSMTERAGFTDTHPSLADRLSALGVPANAQTEAKERATLLPTAPAETAAQRYFGPALPHFLEQITQSWRRGIAGAWRNRHQASLKAVERLRALWGQEQNQPLTKEERWERIQLTLEYRDEDEAIPLLEAEIAADPEAAGACLHLGRILLERGDARGVEVMEQAIKIDDDATLPACELIIYYLQGVGRYSDAAAYRKRADDRRTLELVASEERDDLKPSDRFVYHSLDLQKLTQIKGALKAIPQISEAYLVRKHVTTFSEKPLYVVAFVLTPSAQKALNEGQSLDALGNSIVQALDLKAETFFVILGKANKALGNAIKNAPSSKIV